MARISLGTVRAYYLSLAVMVAGFVWQSCSYLRLTMRMY